MIFTAVKTTITNRWHVLRLGWKSLSANKIISLATYCAVVCSLIGFISIVFSWNTLPPFVPLWYSKIWGAERLAATPWLFLLPSSTLIITVINAYIATFLTNEYLVFSQIMSLGSFVISLLSTITLIKIIFLVL
ncbi:MAG: hypothetical protein WAV51_04205 [Microgenomates group bacterium]